MMVVAALFLWGDTVVSDIDEMAMAIARLSSKDRFFGSCSFPVRPRRDACGRTVHPRFVARAANQHADFGPAHEAASRRFLKKLAAGS